MTLPNIGLIGRMRSGKDTVADYLTDEDGDYGYLRYAFGDGIREVCRRLYLDQFADGKKPRALLQQFGEYARSHDRDVWINDMFRRMSANEYTRYVPVVVSDVRQPHEVDALRERGFIFIRITAPEAVRIDRAIKSADSFALRDLTHDTESHVDGFAVEYEIVNDGSLDDLYAKIDAIMREINGGERQCPRTKRINAATKPATCTDALAQTAANLTMIGRR